jgi:glycosyltransferase involved in cell wall biosynthesis
MRFHILGIPHTATTKDYSSCAFTQKVLKLCKMLKMQGHTVFHYGNELSEVECDENIAVTYKHDIAPPETSGKFDHLNLTVMKFNAIAHAEILRRKQRWDFLCCAWPAHSNIAMQHSADMLVVETGIGYPEGHFAPYKVFESYAMLHAYRGLDAVKTANGNGWWYDVVIANSFDPEDFTYREDKEDYLLFMGQRSIGGDGKGINIACQIAERTGRRMVVVGPGEIGFELPRGVGREGFVGPKRRAQLMSRARAVLCPSLFVEPFCGVSIEAALCGTPVICSDWGALSENVLHGVTGWRCRTMGQFVWAVQHVGRIKPADCRAWAADNFSLARMSGLYDAYFRSLMHIATGKGWYAPHDGDDLEFFARHYPEGVHDGQTDHRPRIRGVAG